MQGTGEPGIVVGVSGSRGSLRALCWAAAEARRLQRPLRVVLTWEASRLACYTPATAHADRDQQERAARQRLAVALGSAFGPVVPREVVAQVIEGRAERALADESAGAELLVLGAARARSPSGSCLGPVTRGCLALARCPVAVIGPRVAVTTPDATAPDDANSPADDAVNLSEANAMTSTEGAPEFTALATI